MKTTLTYLILAFFICNSNLLAQTTISGTLTDQKGEALVGANVYIDGTYDGTSSNVNGEFNLQTNETGNKVLKVDYIGFETIAKEVDLDGKKQDLDLQLKEAFNELKAVTISAGTFEAGDKKKSISVNSIDMLTTAGSAGDVIGAMQTLPGTTTVGESGKLFVKGGDSRESKLFIDGTLVYVPYSSSSPNQAVRGRFSPFLFSGTMFSTGGYSAEYGQALSSVLSMKTTDVAVEDQLNISVISVGGELGGSKTWDKGSVKVNLGYFNLEPYFKAVPQNQDWIKTPESYSGEVSFRLKTAKSGLFKIYTSLNQTNFALNQTDINNLESKYKFDLTNTNNFVNTSWAGEIKKDWILTTGLSLTNNLDEILIDTLKNDKSIKGSHLKIGLKHSLNKYVKLISGVEWYAKNYSNKYYNNNFLYNPHFSNHTFAGYVEGEFYTSTNFVTRIGFRAEHSQLLNKNSIAPRISTAYKINNNSQFSLSYGWFFQDPADEYLTKTRKVDFERADHYTLNYILKGKDRILRTELYYKDYKNLMKFGNEETNIENYYKTNGTGYAYGLDLFWRDKKSLKHTEYWITYSYINSERNYLDYPEQAMPTFTSKHNLSMVFKHWFSDIRSNFSATYRASSPRVYNNPNSSEFNSERTIPFQTLDISWAYLHRENVIFYLSASNVLGFKQHFGYEYASTPNQQGYYNSLPKEPGAKRFIIVGCFITLSKSGSVNQMDKIN